MNEEKRNPKILPNDPATEKQRVLLRLAITKDWLNPNPFAGNHRKWEELKAGEADKLLASIPPERLGVLERELQVQKKSRIDKGMARGIGHGVEDVIKQIGHSIDGGIG